VHITVLHNKAQNNAGNLNSEHPQKHQSSKMSYKTGGAQHIPTEQ